MEFSNYFPMWSKLTPAQQDQLSGSIIRQTVKKGTLIHNGSNDCIGLLLIKSGQLRSYILSEEGREVITRMLRYFQNEEMIRVTRGTVEIMAEDKLTALQNI